MARVGGKTIASMARPSNTGAQAQKAPATPVQTAKAPETPVEAKTENKGQQAPETPKKEVKMPEPKAWQRLDVSDPNKPKLVNQITFLGEKMDYEPGFKAEYEWHNLDNADGLRRVVTAKFPKSNSRQHRHSRFGYKSTAPLVRQSADASWKVLRMKRVTDQERSPQHAPNGAGCIAGSPEPEGCKRKRNLHNTLGYYRSGNKEKERTQVQDQEPR